MVVANTNTQSERDRCWTQIDQSFNKNNQLFAELEYGQFTFPKHTVLSTIAEYFKGLTYIVVPGNNESIVVSVIQYGSRH
jgi:hypothetical protein